MAPESISAIAPGAEAEFQQEAPEQAQASGLKKFLPLAAAAAALPFLLG